VLFFTPWPAEYLRAKILAQASALTGAEMSIGSLELRFFPPRLILRDVHLARKDPTGEELRVACDEADVSLPYGVYQGKLDRIDALRLSSPQVFLKRAPRGPTAPAQPPVGPPTTALIPVGVGRLDVSEGELHVVDPHADWEAALAGVNLTAASGEASPLSGRLERCHATFRLGEHRLEGEVSSAFNVDRRSLRLTEVEVAIPEALEASGAFGLDFSGAAPRLQASARARLAPATALPRPILADLSGEVAVEASGELTKGEGLALHGTIQAPEVHFQQVTGRNVSAQADLRGERLEVRRLQGEAVGGKFAAA